MGSLKPNDACPCGSGKPYAACCGPLHAGTRIAPTASALMRSRYSAFARGLADYLLTTWHPATRPALLELDDHTVWTGLTVESVTGGRAWEDTGTVTFSEFQKASLDKMVAFEMSTSRVPSKA